MHLRRKKQVLAFILSLALTLSLVPTAAFATTDDNGLCAARQLYRQGLLQGTGVDENGDPVFDLNRTVTRAEAVTMIVRLLGKEGTAQNGTWILPFDDVPNWAGPYVGYAYWHHLTNGTSDSTFGSTQTITATEYLTFVLRILGYTSGVDFQWDRAWELSDQIKLTFGEYDENTKIFTRGDMAEISCRVVNTCIHPETGKSFFEIVSYPNRQIAGKVPDSTKYDISALFSQGIDIYNGWIDYILNEMQSNSWDDPKMIGLLRKEQKAILQSVLYFNAAITLCDNYIDTQKLKQSFSEFVAASEVLISYEITEDNVEDYVNNVRTSNTVLEATNNVNTALDEWDNVSTM